MRKSFAWNYSAVLVSLSLTTVQAVDVEPQPRQRPQVKQPKGNDNQRPEVERPRGNDNLRPEPERPRGNDNQRPEPKRPRGNDLINQYQSLNRSCHSSLTRSWGRAENQSCNNWWQIGGL
ncbi:TPA: hypothetical protein EYN65_18540 [Candidatus Poribacteria bacterium]|nr:hypothetical protein [Candidatus Poribacteria bacterium]